MKIEVLQSQWDYTLAVGIDGIRVGPDKGPWTTIAKFEYQTMTSEQARERIEKLESTFRHTHVNSGDGTDACKECGLDLRDKIHIRA